MPNVEYVGGYCGHVSFYKGPYNIRRVHGIINSKISGKFE